MIMQAQAADMVPRILRVLIHRLGDASANVRNEAAVTIVHVGIYIYRMTMSVLQNEF